MSIAYNENFSIMDSGRLLPCVFGARGDGFHNDTNGNPPYERKALLG